MPSRPRRGRKSLRSSTLRFMESLQPRRACNGTINRRGADSARSRRHSPHLHRVGPSSTARLRRLRRRIPKPGGISNGSWRASCSFLKRIGPMNPAARGAHAPSRVVFGALAEHFSMRGHVPVCETRTGATETVALPRPNAGSREGSIRVSLRAASAGFPRCASPEPVPVRCTRFVKLVSVPVPCAGAVPRPPTCCDR